MTTPMMKCGHAANAVDSKTMKPICVICIGLTPDAEIVAETPNLDGRMAKCAEGKCGSMRPSSTSLAFFQHRPEREYDSYYCGCRGWD